MAANLQTMYFLHYNNYYNRIVKREETLEGYIPYQAGDPLVKCNFNPNDGVSTFHFVNWSSQIPHTTPDYCIVYDNDAQQILSRWFVLEAARTRDGQMRFTLRRDLIADFYELILSAPAFIEKGMLLASDPMIFNSEDMSYNQIRQGETLLMDETQTPWVVGFIPRNAFSSSTNITAEIPTTSEIADIVVADIESWEYYKYVNRYFYSYPSGSNITLFVNYQINVGGEYRSQDVAILNGNGNLISVDYSEESRPSLSASAPRGVYNSNRSIIGQKLTNGFSSISNEIRREISLYNGTASEVETNSFFSLNQKIIFDSITGIAYKITVKRAENAFIPEYTRINPSSSLGSLLSGALTYNFDVGYSNIQFSGTPDSGTFGMILDVVQNTYTISLEQLSVSLSVNIDNDRYHLEDSPYDMFCLPYLNVPIYQNGEKLFDSNGSLSVMLATEIGARSGEGSVYDIQLLPYCPVRYAIQEDGSLDVKGAKVDFVKDSNNNNVSVLFWGTNSTFTFDIIHPISVPNDAIEKKVEAETGFYRLCSPNYNGIFQFSAVKNDGVERFSVSCTYKPFMPFIQLKPNFGGLYGDDPLKDYRGLICGGDYSLTQIKDYFATYELQNKNYQAIFNRQIQNMETNNAVQREREIWGAVSGALGATAGGAMTGAQVGGAWGAVVGGVIGGAASTAAGVRDVQLNDKLRSEALDYSRDLYGYNLGNIKALPDSLSKTSALVYNNKLFPFLEYYSCTSTEKDALRNKIKYNGMTVMRIGTVQEFLRSERTYIKAKIIRIEDLEDEYHMLNEIASEMSKGVFI